MCVHVLGDVARCAVPDALFRDLRGRADAVEMRDVHVPEAVHRHRRQTGATLDRSEPLRRILRVDRRAELSHEHEPAIVPCAARSQPCAVLKRTLPRERLQRERPERSLTSCGCRLALADRDVTAHRHERLTYRRDVGSNGASTVQPDGLEDLTGVTDIDAGTAWANLDPFAEAIANGEGLGAPVPAFVANSADALILATLKESTGSNKPLLSPDPTSPTRRLLQGVALFVAPSVKAGTVWGIPRDRAFVVRRNDVDLQIDRSAYFTSDRTAIRATMRVAFAFAHAAAIQKITLTD